MKEGYEKYCRNGLCEGESKPKKYYLDEHDHEELKDKCWYSGCQCPGERQIIPEEKQQQKQHLIDMMNDDEDLGLYNRTFEDYLQKLKDRRTEDDYKYTYEDFKNRIHYIFDCYEKDLSVYKCLEFMYFVEREIQPEQIWNDEKMEGVKNLIQEHKQEALEQIVSKQFQKDFNDEVGNVLVQELKKKETKPSAVEWLYKNLLENPISNQDIEYNEAVLENAKEMEKRQHNLLPGLTKQFDPKEGEINGEQWTAVHFLKWLELNKFKIIK